MTFAIVTVFLLGYLLITLETTIKVNKTAIALLLSIILWVLYMANCHNYLPAVHPDIDISHLQWADIKAFVVSHLFIDHVGDASEIIFFLLGAMTVVEVVDANGGFNFVRDKVATKSERALLWRVAFMTFCLSAVLDNLTSSIVMVMVLRKLISNRKARMRFAGIVVVAANSGGAFSPIGDVTTIMLWIKGYITSAGVISELLVPSIVSLLVPLIIMGHRMKGQLHMPKDEENKHSSQYAFSKGERAAVFYVGVVGLVFVPIFRALTGLPPFMGVLLVLSLLWVLTEYFCRKHHSDSPAQVSRVGSLLSRIDLSTLLFFLGILLAVGALQETGALHTFGQILEDISGGNAYLVTGVIGVASSIVDNVPLVASCMGMYDMASTVAAGTNPELLNFVQDGTFWQLLAFCAGTGGSILIIGSAAGVVVMGLEHITFGWYVRHISLLAFIGLISGMLCYWVEKMLFF